MSELKSVSVSNDVAIATFRHVLICHFRKKTPAVSAATLQTAIQTLPRAEKVVFFGVIEIESDPPDTEARERFTKFFEDNADRFACAIVAYRGEGFRGAMVRTIVSGIFHLMPKFRFAFPRQVVGSLDEGATQALKHAPGLDTAALLAAVRELSAK